MFIDELLKPSEIHALINDSDVCINFPKTDQLSATLLEAIFYGKKVICSNVPAYQEFFSLCKQTGIQPTVASPDALEKTLIDVIKFFNTNFVSCRNKFRPTRLSVLLKLVLSSKLNSTTLHSCDAEGV